MAAKGGRRMVENMKLAQATETLDIAPYPTLHRQTKGKLVSVREIAVKDDAFDLKRMAVPARPRARFENGRAIQLVFIGDRDIPVYTFLDYEGWLKEYFVARIGLVFRFRTDVR